jgi:hypothetical protein
MRISSRGTAKEEEYTPTCLASMLLYNQSLETVYVLSDLEFSGQGERTMASDYVHTEGGLTRRARKASSAHMFVALC